MPGRNRIGPEDRALWRKVMKDAVPLAGKLGDPLRGRTALPEASHAGTKGVAPPPVPGRTLKPAGTGEPPIRISRADGGPARVGRPEPGLDRRSAERLRRGERYPDGRIDLHGMTAERAHRALDRCIARALAHGQRLVLVITGKGGKPGGRDDAPFMREDRGVLRQQAPRWLMTGPHADRIVGIYQAHPRHGGAGAFYVYLKKPRP